MTLVLLRSRSALLLALAAGCSLPAAAQLPAAPQVVIDSKPAAQQQPQQPQTQAAPSAAPASSAPTITLQSNPGAPASAPVPAPAPVPVLRPAAGPSLPATTVIIQNNPNAPAARVAPATPPPAPSAAAQPVATTATPDGIGTTIFGEQEAPIGLYITPWKDDYAERGLDRPARLLDEAMEPIDPATFRRQIEYYETITEFRRKQRGEAK